MEFKKAKPLLYWLNDWGGYFLKEENTFEPDKLIKYERGMVVQAHLGFKVGSEQGGLHYALIVENNNGLSDKVVMVIPLRSLKEKEKPKDIDKRFEVFLGCGMLENDIEDTKTRIARLEKRVADIKADKKEEHQKNNERQLREIARNVFRLNNKLKSLQKGTVAQVGQICCLSKLRIYHPTFNGDELSTFKLDPKKLNEIDELVRRLFTKPNIG